MTRLNIK